MILLAVALACGMGNAHAQSSYVLTNLSEPFLGKHGIDEIGGDIDFQNRVTATARYLSGFSLYSWGQNPGPSYTEYVARWGASTATSVSPSKLISKAGYFDHQSPDGSKVFVVASMSPTQYYDTVKGQFVPIPAPSNAAQWSIRSIDDSGAMVGNAYLYLSNPSTSALRAVRWVPGAAAPEILPIGAQYNRSGASFINRQGDVLGEVGELGSERLRAAIWHASGTFEVLNNDPDTTTRPYGLSDSGDALVWMDNTRTATQGYAVISNGVVKPVEPLNPAHQISRFTLNANGVLVGRITDFSLPVGFRERGFIWKDGVLTDLTAWVTAKGVKLPQGTVVAIPWHINAQGSILATLRDATGKTSLARLTARP